MASLPPHPRPLLPALSIALLCTLPSISAAQDAAKSNQQAPSASPGYYAQVNQKLGALLSIYDAPTTSAAVIVQLPGDTIFNSSGEQKQATGTLWQKVSIGEVEGWVHAASLKMAQPIPFVHTDLPIQGICGGTEPSWTVEWNSNTVTYSNIIGMLNRVPFTSVTQASDSAATDLTAGDDDITIHLTISEKQCTYTPLDTFVWGEAKVTITQPGKDVLTLTGCCRPVSGGYK